MSREDFEKYSEIRVFLHHIYEYKKGVRNLVLCTTNRYCANLIIERLRQNNINHILQDVYNDKVNLYFGKEECLNVVRTFVSKPLNLLTPKEDFLLGIMLGYDITRQCERYCANIEKAKTQTTISNVEKFVEISGRCTT